MNLRDVLGEAPALNVFHAHLDVCRQCREHPFALCSAGAVALRAAASAARQRAFRIGTADANYRPGRFDS